MNQSQMDLTASPAPRLPRSEGEWFLTRPLYRLLFQVVRWLAV
jgi:hypothetical protein